MARHDLRNGNGSLKLRIHQFRSASLAFCACALLAAPVLAHAGQITISWDPEASATGYRIYNASSGQPFAAPIEVGNVTSHTLTGLDTAAAYHAAVMAYDEFGQESPLSIEVAYNPREDDPVADTDGDGLLDTLEIAGCTSPTDADTDDDGLADGAEDANLDGVLNAAETSGCAADTDGDGLQDGTEQGLVAALAATDPAVFRPDLDPATTTNPLVADTEGDGLADGAEDLDANGRVDAGETDPNVADNPLLFADTFVDGTKSGDPSWKRIIGSWSVVGSGKRFASTKSGVSMAVIADPKVREFGSGRIETWVSLTRTFAAAPDAQILFHYQDAGHYRYLRLTETGLTLGQVGSNSVASAGVKASLLRRLKLNAGQRVRIDIENGTDVKVYLNGGATPIFSYRFAADGAGRVGFRTVGARSLFDNTAVWSDFVLR